MRMQSQVDQLGVLRVVVMRLGFDSRIGQMIDRALKTQLVGRALHHLRQFQHRELLSELIEDAEFAGVGGILAGYLDTANGVADIEEATRLAALAIDGDGMSRRRLDTETIECRAKDLIIVEAVDERFVQS